MNADVLWSLFFGAVVVETLVNIIRNLKVTADPLEEGPGWVYWTALGVGIFLGLVIALNYNIDVFQLAGMEGQVPYVGAVLTGLIMSRGANIVNDLIDRLNSWRK